VTVPLHDMMRPLSREVQLAALTPRGVA